ncbi:MULTISPECIES: hypothetical protein [Campylobacter]|uniref:hypothetical protein n=1 Tax=Campylobacter TaxID=194 RepID=UPI00146FFE7B|nr:MULTISPECIES: hypothetical protein [Campylobacter]MBN7288331.1 hypothetical protein [Campylobacter curvus]MDU6826975.1 hypothetical protein [Campylobacter sp.]
MIYEELKILTQNSDKKALSKALGYAREQNFTRALANLEAANSLDEFITRGHFDWTHSSETLILALSEYFALNIDAELSEVQKLYNERVKFRGSYIYIDTNFKRKNEPIFVLAMVQHLRYVSLTPFLDKLCFKALDEQLKVISKITKSYYQKTQALPIFGAITGFKLYFIGKNYSLDTNENFTDKEIAEQVATIKF